MGAKDRYETLFAAIVSAASIARLDALQLKKGNLIISASQAPPPIALFILQMPPVEFTRC